MLNELKITSDEIAPQDKLEILAKNSNWTAIDISDTEITKLPSLEHMKNLKTLNLSNTDISDLSPIGCCHSLITLNISNTPVQDISVLKDLKIEKLYLNGSKVDDISVLKEMSSSLKILDASAENDITDFEPIKSLPSLEQLFLNEVPSISSEYILGLKTLTNLTTLEVGSDPELSDAAKHTLREIKLCNRPVQTDNSHHQQTSSTMPQDSESLDGKILNKTSSDKKAEFDSNKTNKPPKDSDPSDVLAGEEDSVPCSNKKK